MPRVHSGHATSGGTHVGQDTIVYGSVLFPYLKIAALSRVAGTILMAAGRAGARGTLL